MRIAIVNHTFSNDEWVKVCEWFLTVYPRTKVIDPTRRIVDLERLRAWLQWGLESREEQIQISFKLDGHPDEVTLFRLKFL